MRCFISLNIPRKITKKILEIQNQLPEFQGKKTKLMNLHLTLKFLGEINGQQLENVKQELSKIKFHVFETEINKLGVFSEKFIKIVWLYLKNCDNLQKQIDERLKNLFEPEKRFMSHLTIARVKKIKDKEKFLQDLVRIKIPKIKFNINKFYLMKSELSSEGAKYKILEEFELI